MKAFLASVCLVFLAESLSAETWIQGRKEFSGGLGTSLEFDGEGRLMPKGDEAVYVSGILGAGENRALKLVGWATNMSGESPMLRVELRGGETPFQPEDPLPAWTPAVNGQTYDLPSGSYFQYRITFQRKQGAPVPFLREILLTTESLAGKLKGKKHPPVEDMTMSMMYGATSDKLYQFYQQLPYDASERGVYILRNAENQKIEPGSYRYVPNGPDMYLPARFGTWIQIRIHPEANFSPLSLHSTQVVSQDKKGNERKREAGRAQSHSVNFFDESFMKEYATGVASAVRYYRENNPYVFGYTIMPPEFFYDTEPWPQMTYLGGFGADAFKSYRDFMARLGISVTAWPKKFSDGDVLLDRDYYLWVYWRHWAGANYINTIAKVIMENDPKALVGTLSYVGDQGLRGGEAGFIENNPNIDYYYSANMFPRVPDKGGWDGGEVFSYTRLNLLGHSRKKNFMEFDVWSPYVDLRRAPAQARYAQVEGIIPVPIVFGDYPNGKPSNHLTRYHGMTGEAMTPAVFSKLAEIMMETRVEPAGKKMSQVAYIMPSLSNYGVLKEGEWKVHRLSQIQQNLLGVLLEQGVTFDIVTEGHASRDVLDKYKLVIIGNACVSPWLRDALSGTRANVLALGWAGTVAAPGPRHVSMDIDPDDFVKDISSAWPRGQAAVGTTIFPTEGKVYEGGTSVRFSGEPHPLLRGLSGAVLPYTGAGLGGHGLPYVAGLKGQPLAADDKGRAMFAVLDQKNRKVIHFGALPYLRDASGEEGSLFDEDQKRAFWGNVFDFCGVERFDNLGVLRVMRTTKGLLVENPGEEEYSGPVPVPAGGGAGSSSEGRGVRIPPYTVVLLGE